MWSHCKVPVFDKKKRNVWWRCEVILSSFLRLRRRDEGASLVGHPVTWRALLFHPPSTAESHHHHGFPWQQPLQESLHKQHRWVSCSQRLCFLFFLTQIKAFCSQWNVSEASALFFFFIKAIASVRHNDVFIHVESFFFLSVRPDRCLRRCLLKAWGISPNQQTPSIEPTRSQSPWNHSLTKVNTHTHTHSSQFLPYYKKLMKHKNLEHI